MRFRIASLTTIALALVITALPIRAQQTITCSSDDGGRHNCPVDTRGGVQMTNQRSGSACTQGYSWGYDRNGIWVDHGCRADFTVNTGWNNGGGVAARPSPAPPMMAAGIPVLSIHAAVCR